MEDMDDMDEWLTDTDVEALLAGEPIPERPDLAELCDAIACLREGIPARPVPWSAELSALMHQSVAQAAPAAAAMPAHRRLVRWAAGLGIAGQTLLVSTGAAAAVATAGLVGVLPGPAQGLFDQITHRQEQPTVTSPPAPWRPQEATPAQADERRVEPDDAEDARGRSGPRREAPERAAAAARPTTPARSPGTEQVPVVHGGTDGGDGDRPQAAPTVPPKKPTTPPRDPRDDREDEADDREDEADDREDEAEDLEDAAEEREDEAQDVAEDATDAEEELAEESGELDER